MTAANPEPRLQFSVRTLFGVITAAALFFGLICLPHWFNQLVVGGIWIVAMGWLVTGVVFARGDQQAFCIGAAVVVASMWTGMGGQFIAGILRLFSGPLVAFSMNISDQFTLWFRLFTLAAAALGNGWLCIRARRYFQRDQADGKNPPD